MKHCPNCTKDSPEHAEDCRLFNGKVSVVDELLPGVFFQNTYRIVHKLGEGSLGPVYLADHVYLDELRALRLLPREINHDEVLIARVRRELAALRDVRSRHVVNSSDLQRADDGRLFMAMEYVDGPDLRTLLDIAPDPLDVELTLVLARCVMQGLAAAHAGGLVHRDFKPKNILLAREGNTWVPKIKGFALVAIKEHFATPRPTGEIVLSPTYAAPEQWYGTDASDLDGRTDLYALGGVLYEMLTGHTPFHASDYEGWAMQHIKAEPLPPSVLRPDLANWNGLDHLVLNLLAKQCEGRPRSASDLIPMIDTVRLGNSEPLAAAPMAAAPMPATPSVVEEEAQAAPVPEPILPEIAEEAPVAVAEPVTPVVMEETVLADEEPAVAPYAEPSEPVSGTHTVMPDANEAVPETHPAVPEPFAAFSRTSAAVPESSKPVSEFSATASTPRPVFSVPSSVFSAAGFYLRQESPVVEEEPAPVVPAYSYFTPMETAQKEEPVSTDPEPVGIVASEAVIEPAPAVAEPELLIAEPELAVAVPELTAAEPELAVDEPELAAAEPELAVAEPEPAIAEPEMVAAEPEIELPISPVEPPVVTASAKTGAASERMREEPDEFEMLLSRYAQMSAELATEKLVKPEPPVRIPDILKDPVQRTKEVPDRGYTFISTDRSRDPGLQPATPEKSEAGKTFAGSAAELSDEQRELMELQRMFSNTHAAMSPDKKAGKIDRPVRPSNFPEKAREFDMPAGVPVEQKPWPDSVGILKAPVVAASVPEIPLAPLPVPVAVPEPKPDQSAEKHPPEKVSSERFSNPIWKIMAALILLSAVGFAGWRMNYTDPKLPPAKLSQGCNAGDAKVCTQLAAWYEQTNVVKDGDAQAVTYYGKACNGSVALACRKLAFKYQFGRGIPQDKARALPLFQKACDQGDYESCDTLADFYHNGTDVTVDDAKAMDLYNKACAVGDDFGCSWAARIQAAQTPPPPAHRPRLTATAEPAPDANQ